MKPSPERATLERQGKRKEKRRPTENGTRPAEEGEDRSAWTNMTRRKPTTTSARNGPNLPGERRTQEHMKKEEKGTHGELVNDMMHPQRRAVFPSLGSTACIHVNPIDGYQCSDELRAQLNLTEKPKRSDHTCKACPEACHAKKSEARTASSCSTLIDRQVKPEKRPAVSLYLNELLIQKCKFRIKKVKPGTVARSSTLRPTGETMKNGQQFTLLRRITNSKV